MNSTNKVISNLNKFIAQAKERGLKVLAIEAEKSKDMNFREGGRPGKWKDKINSDGRANLTGKSGALQIRTTPKIDFALSKVSLGNTLVYGRIQNDGGRIMKTAKMRGFFWAMYYNTRRKGRKGEPAPEQPKEAQFWRNMALSKKDYIEIPKREYVVIPPSDFPRILNSLGRVINSIRI